MKTSSIIFSNFTYYYIYSGVQIGPLDLGKIDMAYLLQIGLSEDIIKKLELYVGLLGKDAKEILKLKPLTLKPEEFSELWSKVFDDYMKNLKWPGNFDQGEKFHLLYNYMLYFCALCVSIELKGLFYIGSVLGYGVGGFSLIPAYSGI